MADAAQNPTTRQVSPPTDDRATAVAPTIVQSIASAPPLKPEPQTPSRAKELGTVLASETTPLVEVTSGAAAIEQEPIPEDVEAWMEKVGPTEAQAKLENLPAVQIPSPAQSSPSVGKTAFVLPLGEAELKAGSAANVNDSIRWLATWCQRIIKQLRGQVVFRGN